jgi:hypothetical protein
VNLRWHERAKFTECAGKIIDSGYYYPTGYTSSWRNMLPISLNKNNYTEARNGDKGIIMTRFTTQYKSITVCLVQIKNKYTLIGIKGIKVLSGTLPPLGIYTKNES